MAIKKTGLNTLKLTQTAILSAVIIMMAFVPFLGYIHLGPLSATTLVIPVAIGAAVIGPGAGAFQGLNIGATSYVQCIGLDPFGTTLNEINPFFTLVMCFVPRILMGLLSGLIYKAVSKVSPLAGAITCSIAAPALNTFFFVGALMLFFGSSEYIQGFGNSFIAIVAVLITWNAVFELATTGVLGSLISPLIVKLEKKFKR
ncbi:MAG: ECF transporter S component [Clostridia bacterium]|nr:ECF transporter S component [Clostridia bacterium]